MSRGGEGEWGEGRGGEGRNMRRASGVGVGAWGVACGGVVGDS